ncbi:MAG: COX15/CtaA family protein [Gammaproteobacteria bacterium]|nr:COX15/CtaA family protein [Gammaproteobacteria bacterium]
MKKLLTHKFTFATAVLALVVILLGAFTRLSDAGLGCPDWPGCYGHLSVPQTEQALSKALELFPDHQVVAAKAWPEMIHRYFAGALGLLVFTVCYLLIKYREELKNMTPLAVGLGGLIIFQALLGMWTVTLGLWPVTVMGHLLGGFITLNLLWYITLRLRDRKHDQFPHELTGWVRFAMLVVLGQIFLGGWTSSNYAAIICSDFPTCQGSMLPPMDFVSAFQLWGHGVDNYEFGILGNDARVTIQWTHRLGAYITVAVLIAMMVKVWRYKRFRNFVKIIAGLMTIQVVLGISNVLLSIPMAVALAHNGVAVLLLLSLVTLFHYMSLPKERF